MRHLKKKQIQNLERFQLLDRTFYNSILRHISSQYVYRISIRSFLQFSHRCMISSRWKNLLENFKQCIAEKVSKVISLRKSAGNNDNHSRFSIDREFVALRKLARKFQTSEFASLKKLARKFQIDQNICFEQKTQTNAVRKCWKIQFSQKDDQEFNWYNLTKEELVRSHWV